MPTVAPYGSWSSPIDLDRLVAGAVGVSFPMASADHLYWVEQRPHEGGRSVLVRAAPDGSSPVDAVGPEVSVRSAVHEYGGLAHAILSGIVPDSGTVPDSRTVPGDTVVLVDATDQRLVRLDPDGTCVPLTPPPPAPRAVRHGAPVVVPGGRFVLAIRERHQQPDRADTVVDEVVAVPLDGSGDVTVLLEGHDFFGHVTPSPDGHRVAWVQWDHPDMPWDATELWEGELVVVPAGGVGTSGVSDGGAGDGVGDDADGGAATGSARLAVAGAHRVAGGPGESVVQPMYGPDGTLFYVSDRSGWWNLYRVVDGEHRAVVSVDADLAEPDWVLGTANHAVLADGTVLATWSADGRAHVGVWRPDTDRCTVQRTEWVSFAFVRGTADGRGAVAVASSALAPPAVVALRPSGPEQVAVEPLHRSRRAALAPDAVSVAEPLEVPGPDGAVIHAFHYPPRHPGFVGPAGARPPAIIRSHGGPTAMASPAYNEAVQFWTSRGVAVIDVNYGGSSGYGRAYRQRLAGQWGVVDVADTVAVARFVADHGLADPDRLVVMGSSAGGLTVLGAVTTTDVFAAGIVSYGVADLADLARDTHKFEAHYLDRLVGPWPEAEAVYRERSPLGRLDRLHTPMVLFQGLDDPVVPPEQTARVVAALDAARVPHACLTYEGEAHGFRRAEHIRRTAEAQLAFLGVVLGFEPADDLAPLTIHHADRLARR